ncbi:Bacitracin export permease protein BceB [compost metagenome]
MKLMLDLNKLRMPVISEESIPGVALSEDESLFAGDSSALQQFMSFKNSGPIEFKGQHEVIPQQYIGLKKESVLSSYFTGGGLPVAIVDEAVFQRLKHDLDPTIQEPSSLYIGIDLKDSAQIKAANELFHEIGFSDKNSYASQLQISNNQKQIMGLIMFIVGFLGLTFLITSGCILYFKQMDESEDEKASYTILRKLGFTQADLIRGIQRKQIFNFGIPLVVGLLHSYFAVQSGWFFFGTELWTPMIIVMVLYTALYSVFGMLSVLHYKKVIKESL